MLFILIMILKFANNLCVAYFSYHAKVKKLINAGELTDFKFVEKYNKISPALVLFFKTAPPMPIRQHRFNEYVCLLKDRGFEIKIPSKFKNFE